SAPVILWAKHGTLISARNVLRAVAPPAGSVILGAAASLATGSLVRSVEPALLRLVAESGVLFGVYLLALLFLMNQKDLYFALLRETGLWPIGVSNSSIGPIR